MRHGKLSSANELFALMQEEYIEIVDEIAGECAFEFYEEVRRRVVEQKEPTNAYAAASKPDVMIVDSDDYDEDEETPAPYHEVAGITDGDQKIAASEEAPNKRKEAAQVMASFRQNPTLHDTERKGPQKSEKASQAQTGKKRKRGKKAITTPQDVTICNAGQECRLGDTDVVVEGNASNGSLCSKCQQTFHFVCLHRFGEDNYCTDCYKEHVVSRCSTGTLFEDLLQSKETAKAKTVHTHTHTVISLSMWIIF